MRVSGEMLMVGSYHGKFFDGFPQQNLLWVSCEQLGHRATEFMVYAASSLFRVILPLQLHKRELQSLRPRNLSSFLLSHQFLPAVRFLAHCS